MQTWLKRKSRLVILMINASYCYRACSEFTAGLRFTSKTRIFIEAGYEINFWFPLYWEWFSISVFFYNLLYINSFHVSVLYV